MFLLLRQPSPKNIIQLFLLLLLFLPFEVSAVSVSPLRQMVIIDPGSAQVVSITVENDTDETVAIVPNVDAFTIDSTTGRAQFGATDAAVQWVHAEPQEVILKAKEKENISFTISVPPDAAPGGHYLALFAQTKQDNQHVAVGTRIGSLLFLTVSGDVREELVIEQFAPEALSVFTSPVTLHVRLRNTGNTHVQPKGYVSVYTMANKEILRVPVNASERKVLPGGLFKEDVVVPLDNVYGGRATAHLDVRYGITDQTNRSTAIFWFIPWQIGAMLGALIAVALFWYTVARKK